MGARVGDSALRWPRSNQPKGGRREEEQGREQLHVELSPTAQPGRAGFRLLPG